jgi:endonuclease/exonuclease/phosphatase family metal-dependent hydrolase
LKLQTPNVNYHLKTLSIPLVTRLSLPQKMLLVLFIFIILMPSYSTIPIQTIKKERLKLMTYNIRHAKGLDNVVKLNRIEEKIRLSGADIVALQEVDRYLPRSQFTDQVHSLATGLNMHYTFAPTLSMAFMQYGNAILSKYPIVHTSVVPLPGWGEPRAMMTATVSIHGHEIDVVNLHLGVHAEDRAEQFAVVLAEMKKRQAPSILMGDFNMLAESEHLLSLHEVLYPISLDEPSSTVSGGGQIDHIYANFPMMTEQVYTLFSDASDHLPVVAEMSWHPELLQNVGKVDEVDME